MAAAAAAAEADEEGKGPEPDASSPALSYRALRSARASRGASTAGGEARNDERYWARRLWAFMAKVRELKSAPKREKDLDDPADPWARKWGGARK